MTRRDDGFAIVMAVTALMFALALGAGLVLTTSAEALIARHFQVANEALYAAEAALEYAADEVAAEPQWDTLLAGSRQSAFVDGPPSGARTLPDGTAFSLDDIIMTANCGAPTPCTTAEMDLATPERPYGANNARWQAYAWGLLSALPGGIAGPSGFYVVVLVGDDGEENDGDPLRDGGPPSGGEPDNPGRHRVVLRSEAIGPGGARRTVEVVVARSIARLSWREVP